MAYRVLAAIVIQIGSTSFDFLFTNVDFVNVATKTISTRVDEDEAAWIEALAEMEGCDRSTFIKSVLRRGIRALRFERAVADYSKGEATLSRAAELGGLSTWDFLVMMPQERLELHYGVDEFEEDLAACRDRTTS